LTPRLKAKFQSCSNAEPEAVAAAWARLVEGKAEHRSGLAVSLLPGEREQGYRLLCATEPKGECRFSVAYDSARRCWPTD
jgi:hypothetical protein